MGASWVFLYDGYRMSTALQLEFCSASNNSSRRYYVFILAGPRHKCRLHGTDFSCKPGVWDPMIHGNRKSMGFGRKWRRESPTIKCIIVFSFIIVCPFHHTYQMVRPPIQGDESFSDQH
ncbi:hypothetical protein H0E87_030582 [Populus deltoides]|uniref:Uncharacterized protein n=1 Tax=Populus deltoides TaxID=3696 RepID=A0A8T2WHB6_POPDE|nr:hypothetical protein H0E87_030582 [Populus deltoides]